MCIEMHGCKDTKNIETGKEKRRKIWKKRKKNLSLHRQDANFDYPVNIPYECRMGARLD